MIKYSILVLTFFGISFQFTMASEKSVAIDSLLELSKNLQYEDLDSAVNNFQICLDYYQEVGDTNKIIETRLFLIEKYAGMGKYLMAYDYAWTLIPLVQSPGYDIQKVHIYNHLLNLYMIFEQYEKALEYLEKTIEMAEKLDLDEAEKSSILCELTSAKAWLVTKSTGNLELAEELRIKSIEYSKLTGNDTKVMFHKMHLGNLYVEMYRLEEASQILKEIDQQFPIFPYPIHSLLYNYMGHLYLKYNNVDSAILYYEKSVAAIKVFRNHLDIEVENLEALSDCYTRKGQKGMALEYLKEAKAIADTLFGSRSSQNKLLFEIKDKHAQQIKHKEEEIKNQRLVILERDKQIWVLSSILFVAALLIIIVILIARHKKTLYKQKAKQELLNKKREFENLKQAEIIKLKNKELMTSTLKVIESDTLLDDIKKLLENLNFSGENKKAIQEVTQTISINRSKKWEEFEFYFNSVNDTFYSAIKHNFPSLTPSELKLCALIKLGFSSKDMAQIMSIGDKGINTARSKIRKKMDLSRDVNLIEYFQNYPMRL